MAIIIHHHLGLGDHFVCNGLVNYICKISEEPIHLICKKHNTETVKYLYSENEKVTVISIDGLDEISEVNDYASRTNNKVLRIGFEHCDPKSWDTSFYKQLNIDFIERYRFFKLPRQKPLNLIKAPKVPYVLVHNESSQQKYKLSINTNLDIFYMDKQEGYHLLSYIDIITNAEEIHCIDSSIFHLIDSIPNITNKLYFHNIRKPLTYFNKSIKWETISYEY
jgi:hypothetical protein